MKRFSFSEVEEVPAEAGIYEIYTLGGVRLKVGIGGNLRKRLKHHAASKKKYLQLQPGGKWSNPADVVSKRSILAKHLYFERGLKEARGFNLKTEKGRRGFLLAKCRFTFRVTRNRDAARAIERVSERNGHFRYVGSPRLRT